MLFPVKELVAIAARNQRIEELLPLLISSFRPLETLEFRQSELRPEVPCATGSQATVRLCEMSHTSNLSLLGTNLDRTIHNKHVTIYLASLVKWQPQIRPRSCFLAGGRGFALQMTPRLSSRPSGAVNRKSHLCAHPGSPGAGGFTESR